MHTLRSSFVSGVACLLITAACSSDPEPRPRYATGLDGSAQVSSLDDDDLQQICESYDVYVNTDVDLEQIAYIACLPTAFFSLTPEACRTSLNNCMALFPKIKVSAKADDRQVCAQTLRQCQAKVADLEGCVTVNVDRVLDIATVWSCDRVTDARYRDMVQSNGLVNVCTNLDSACNGFAAVQSPD